MVHEMSPKCGEIQKMWSSVVIWLAQNAFCATTHILHEQRHGQSKEYMMLHNHDERGASDRTKRRAKLAIARHKVYHTSPQKSPSESLAQPRSTFYRNQVH